MPVGGEVGKDLNFSDQGAHETGRNTVKFVESENMRCLRESFDSSVVEGEAYVQRLSDNMAV